MKILYVCLLCLMLSGCYQSHSDDNLRSVPVTNNPHILPPSAQNGGAPRFGN